MNDLLVCDTPETISAYRLLALRSMLNLEIKGMKRSRGPSAFAMVKSQFGFKGSKQKVAAEFEKYLRDNGILV
jgi:anion-transporting  ArsA/GET3 family ATPase